MIEYVMETGFNCLICDTEKDTSGEEPTFFQFGVVACHITVKLLFLFVSRETLEENICGTI